MNGGKRHIKFDWRKLADLTIIGLGLAFALYLFTRAGDSQSHVWEWNSLWQYFAWRDDAGALHAGLLSLGLFTTLRIGFWAMLLAVLLGLCFGFMRGSPFLFFRLLAHTYVGMVRNIPPLVLVFVVHFFVATLFEPFVSWSKICDTLKAVPLTWVFLPLEGNLDFFSSAVFALGLYEGAYAAEVVRAGLESVPKGQWEAARSLGFSRRGMLLRVILPQAFRLMLPPLVSQSVTLMKDSSIVSAISVAELTYQGRSLMNTTFMVFEIWVSIALIYLAISLVISGLGHLLERRIKWQVI